jgi:hypothetical protein
MLRRRVRGSRELLCQRSMDGGNYQPVATSWHIGDWRRSCFGSRVYDKGNCCTKHCTTLGNGHTIDRNYCFSGYQHSAQALGTCVYNFEPNQHRSESCCHHHHHHHHGCTSDFRYHYHYHCHYHSNGLYNSSNHKENNDNDEASNQLRVPTRMGEQVLPCMFRNQTVPIGHTIQARNQLPNTIVHIARVHAMLTSAGKQHRHMILRICSRVDHHHHR